MFKFLKKRKINEFVESAKKYLSANYKEQAVPNQSSKEKRDKEPQIRYSLRIDVNDKPQDKSVSDSAALHNNKDFNDDSFRNVLAGSKGSVNADDSHEKNTLRDNYDSEIISRTLKNLSQTNSHSHILKTIDENTDASFIDKMCENISKRGLKNSDVYKAAHIDRRLFYKITADSTYKPAKDTCIAICLAIRLTLSETNDLLSRAGYTFSHSNRRDVILEYCIVDKIYNLNDVNEVLFRLNQKTIGC